MNIWGGTDLDAYPWDLVSVELGEKVMLALAFENHGWHSSRALFLTHLWRMGKDRA